MSALTFDKSELGNLEYSLQREMLSTDRLGGYMGTTIVCCNTRKYHGLMVSPIDDSDRTYVLLSSLDETVIQHDQSFNLALHRYPGVYEPRGHKYITDFEYTPTPTITILVAAWLLPKRLSRCHKRPQLIIRYALAHAHSPTRLLLRPFLAFRDNHALSKANMEADGHSYPAVNGVKCRLYGSFPWLYLQTSKPEAEFVPAPDWYYNFEYQQELARGYEGHEDLLTTGYFEMELKKGESVIFSASLDEMGSTNTIEEVFEPSIARRTHNTAFISCLPHSARQFRIRRPGPPHHAQAVPTSLGGIGRETFLSLPGITLEQDHKEDCIDVLDTLVREMRDGMFTGSYSASAEVDAPLWFFWTLQQLEKQLGAAEIWKRYGEVMKQLLESYRRGIDGRVRLHDNGLIWAWSDAEPLTWMDAKVDGRAVTPRNGYQVEVNALWYNAVCYALTLARQNGDVPFVKEWEELPARTKVSFLEHFILPEGYLADYVNQMECNKFIRPNMVIACSLDYKMLDEEQQLGVLRVVRQHLLTPRGLRTLSPRNPLYKGMLDGTPAERNLAAMNGTVWVWPLAFYVKACFDIDGGRFLHEAEEMLASFNEEIQSYCIGSINEMFDADPPYAPRGAVSQATSVAAVLDIYRMIEAHRPAEPAPKKRSSKTAAKAAEETKPATRKTKTTAKADAAKSDTAVKATKTTAKTAKAAAKRPAAQATKKTKKE